VIPAGSREVWLASRYAVPAEVYADPQDWRRLGIPFDRLVLHDGAIRIVIAHDHAGLCDGFYLDEGCHRWTNGMGPLPRHRRPGDAVLLKGEFAPAACGSAWGSQVGWWPPRRSPIWGKLSRLMPQPRTTGIGGTRTVQGGVGRTFPRCQR
jgi:hypothetical protein